MTFLCATDVPFEDTPDREGPTLRERLQRWTRAFLDRHGIPYVVLCGSLDERITTVRAVLDEFEPFDAERSVSRGEPGSPSDG
ncbi:hypothetical protein [Haloarchaeobius sp. DT45]|uniref:hypothetical protein n=1 Tax=Haloarchaeobius sp. DT45 TaxID=3446116 RepID=UPI003F6BF53E